MVIGQGLLILSTPLITRLYTPEDFGLFAIFSALSSIFITMVALRYENAIPLEHDDRVAAALVTGTALTSVLVAALIGLLVFWFGSAFARLLRLPELAPLLWLLPPCLLLWGMGSALSLWSIRQGTYRLNSVNRVVHYGSQAGGQLGFSLVGGGLGLILGYALGYVARFSHLLLGLQQAERAAFLRPSFGEICQALRRHWQFPVYAAGAAMLQAVSAMLPPILIAMLYGPAMAGLYALAQRVVALPLRLLGESASQVFLGEIRSIGHVGLRRLFQRTALLFAGLGAVGILPLIVISPWVFSLVFGEEWRQAGIIVQLLAPLYLIRLVVTPVSQTLNALQRQDLHLMASTLNLLALFGSFTLGWWLALEINWTIALFSATSSMAFIFYIAVAWLSLRRAGPPRLNHPE